MMTRHKLHALVWLSISAVVMVAAVTYVAPPLFDGPPLNKQFQRYSEEYGLFARELRRNGIADLNEVLMRIRALEDKELRERVMKLEFREWERARFEVTGEEKGDVEQ